MQYDITIIGAGIVGLATALKLKEIDPTLNVVIVEKESEISAHQTGHNSGVIHSGLYYKPGSLKATNCIEGYQLLVDFCKKESVPFEICGKVVVATTEDEIPLLREAFLQRRLNLVYDGNPPEEEIEFNEDELFDFDEPEKPTDNSGVSQ